MWVPRGGLRPLGEVAAACAARYEPHLIGFATAAWCGERLRLRTEPAASPRPAWWPAADAVDEPSLLRAAGELRGAGGAEWERRSAAQRAESLCARVAARAALAACGWDAVAYQGSAAGEPTAAPPRGAVQAAPLGGGSQCPARVSISHEQRAAAAGGVAAAVAVVPRGGAAPPGVGVDLVQPQRLQRLLRGPLRERFLARLRLSDSHAEDALVLMAVLMWGAREALAKAVGRNEAYSVDEVALRPAAEHPQLSAELSLSGRPARAAEAAGLNPTGHLWAAAVPADAWPPTTAAPEPAPVVIIAVLPS
eukprot:TRINITY_DN57034_c0_g1_i1.p1 TRINITY_DN57034_c0_g1~~TRINITY_DN57034_c0_g1_i1.p1  ORF type:complete len:349 (+),score=85.16 TRINITY_DN57034_c0_g1_i1:124-1047(+)